MQTYTNLDNQRGSQKQHTGTPNKTHKPKHTYTQTETHTDISGQNDI